MAAILAVALPAHASDDAATLLAMINDDRAAAGHPALRTDQRLQAQAEEHAEQMARAGEPFPAALVLPQRFSMMAETVGVDATVNRVHRALMDSPRHRKNLLRARFDRAGIGVARAGGEVFVVEILADATAAAPPPVGPASTQTDHFTQPLQRTGSIDRLSPDAGPAPTAASDRSTIAIVLAAGVLLAVMGARRARPRVPETSVAAAPTSRAPSAAPSMRLRPPAQRVVRSLALGRAPFVPCASRKLPKEGKRAGL